jgi:predicted deacylase
MVFKNKWVRIVLLLVCALPAGYALSWNRDWFYFYVRQHTVVRDLQFLEQDIRQTGLRMQSIGDVRYGADTFPLWSLESHAPNARKTVCLAGGVHGNEPAGTQALLALARNLAKAAEANSTIRYAMIPLVNPWGWARDLRHNGSNLDAARQFGSSAAQETEVFKKFIQQQRCDMLIDLHEDRFHEGFYALAYAPPDLAKIHAAIASVEKQTGVAHASEPPMGVWNVQARDFDQVRLPTASLWARQHGVVHALILETQDSLPMDKRVHIHLAAIADFAKLLAD